MSGGTNSWTLSLGTASNITDNGGGYSLNMKGAGGTLVLSANDTFSGGTTITPERSRWPTRTRCKTALPRSTQSMASASPAIGTFCLGGLAGGGSFALSNASGGAFALQVGGNGANTTYSGTLGGAARWSKSAAARWS